MPKGQTIHHAARRVGGALVDRTIRSVEAPQPRHLPMPPMPALLRAAAPSGAA